MNNRNKILAGLLVVQLALILIMFRGADDSQTDTVLLSGLAVEQVDRVRIVDEEGKELVLRRLEGAWQVEIEKEVWYPSDNEKVEAMLTKLAGLNSSRLVTRTRASHGRLKVGDDKFARRLELSSGGNNLVKLYLGTAPNYKTIHVRAAGDDNVYLVNDLAAWEVQADPGSWWRTSYVEIGRESLLEVQLHNETGEFVLERKDLQSDWSLRGSGLKLNREKLLGFLDDASQLSVTEIIPPSAAKPKGDPLAVLKLKSAGQQVELLLWDRKDENSDHPVKSSTSSFYAMAGRYAVDALLTVGEGDLVDSEGQTKE